MGMGVFTRTATWTLDGQAGMSKQADRPDCEYRRQSRERRRRGVTGFHSVVVRCISGTCKFPVQILIYPIIIEKGPQDLLRFFPFFYSPKEPSAFQSMAFFR